MQAESNFIKFGGFIGFTSVFLLVLLKDRDIVNAVSDASVACVVMAIVFQQFHSYARSLENQISEAKAKQKISSEDDAKSGRVREAPLLRS
jgi:uncharacterized membrane protein YjfL (UPF0719 family)